MTRSSVNFVPASALAKSLFLALANSSDCRLARLDFSHLLAGYAALINGIAGATTNRLRFSRTSHNI
jgi:hypothetical protein